MGSGHNGAPTSKVSGDWTTGVQTAERGYREGAGMAVILLARRLLHKSPSAPALRGRRN